MFKMTKNKVAKILKIYSIINVIGGFVVTVLLSENLPISVSDSVSFIYAASVIVISFLIFTLGEIVDLLAQIRDNTMPSGSANPESMEDVLPDL